MTQLCRLCLSEKPLVEAHIIPNGFWQRLRGMPIVYSTVDAYIPKRAPAGEYDASILCRECDGGFGRWDDYAQTVLSQEVAEANYIVADDGERAAFRLENVDYPRLKLFFLSLLWRASITARPFFREVSLGPFEHRLRELLIRDDPGDPEEFAVVLFQWEGDGNQVVGSPRKRRLEHRTYYEFTFGGYSPIIKVDAQPSPELLRECILRPNTPLIVFCENFLNGPLPERIRKTYLSSQRSLEALRRRDML